MERKESKDVADAGRKSPAPAGAKGDLGDNNGIPALGLRMASFKLDTKDDEETGLSARSARRDAPAEAKSGPTDGGKMQALDSKFDAKLEAKVALDDVGQTVATAKRKLTAEEIQEQKVEAEFEEMMRTPNPGPSIAVNNDARALKVLQGFKIVAMNMRDGATGRMIWESASWGSDMFVAEMKENIPKDILQCRQVSREINFSSVEQLSKFRIEQRIYFQGQCIEQWFFTFGFVIPGSTNTWQQTIEAAPPEEMIPADVLRCVCRRERKAVRGACRGVGHVSRPRTDTLH